MRDSVERWINEDEKRFLLRTPELASGGPKTKAEHIRCWFPELSEEEALEEAKRDDEFRRRNNPGFFVSAYLRRLSRGIPMVDRPSKDIEEARGEWDCYAIAFDRIMRIAFRRVRHSQFRRSAYRREPGRVARRSSARPMARAAASSSSDDSGGSEPPQGDPDLPAKSSRFSDGFRNNLHHFSNLYHNQHIGNNSNNNNRQLPLSWRLGRPGLMAHVFAHIGGDRA